MPPAATRKRSCDGGPLGAPVQLRAWHEAGRLLKLTLARNYEPAVRQTMEPS
jgi:hypothetical protein